MQVLIIDDHALFSEPLKLLLSAAMPDAVIACCQDGEEAVALAQHASFELVLLDWNLGNRLAGVPLIAMLKQTLPGARIVVISGDSNAAVIREAVDGGAVGFVPKESTPALLIDAITVTAHGGIYLPRSVLGPAIGVPPIKAPLHDGNLPTIRQAYPSLTKRQSEVLEFMVRGMPNKQIASTLNISGGTVKQHLNAVFRALGVENRTGAVYLLAKRGVRFT